LVNQIPLDKTDFLFKHALEKISLKEYLDEQLQNAPLFANWEILKGRSIGHISILAPKVIKAKVMH
jgi:hypothetical protein